MLPVPRASSPGIEISTENPLEASDRARRRPPFGITRPKPAGARKSAFDKVLKLRQDIGEGIWDNVDGTQP
ncbi:MAG: hypothetical protein ACR65R_13830 [Methylomicrobium sp.]